MPRTSLAHHSRPAPPVTPTPPSSTDKELGRGRSGVVFAGRDAAGRKIARKVFGTSGLVKLVQYLLLGCPNPYMWSRAAISTAVHRRRVLGVLVEFWFGTKLRVAKAYGSRWNAKMRGFEIDCELIDGHPTALRHPYTGADCEQLRDAVENVLKPLQKHLIRAGCDGLVWQAGFGNPVALNNILREDDHGDGTHRWAWIDLESGVPAVIPANPTTLLAFYLPKCIQYGRPLFDDIDTDKLQAYVASIRKPLELKLGPERAHAFREDLRRLTRAQHAWKRRSRFKSSIAYRLARGDLSRNEARVFVRNPLLWYVREITGALNGAIRSIKPTLARVVSWLRSLDIASAVKTCSRCIVSQKHREALARTYIARRIDHWCSRSQLTIEQSQDLKTRLEADQSGDYLADFGMHLAVKPIVKSMEWGLLPILFLFGWVNQQTLVVTLLSAGALVRTLYTVGRIVQLDASNRAKPWLALAVGTVPVLGNLAYPMQIIHTSTRDGARVAQFILFDTFSRFGRMVPIWGGNDTRTEHFFNRLPDILSRRRRNPTNA